MAVTPVGTPPATVYSTTNGANSPTLAYGSTPVAGQLLVLAVTAAATTSVTAISAPSGWLTAVNVGNGTTSNARAAIFYKIAAGSDAVPSITVTTSGTTRCGFSVFQFSGVNTNSPVDTSGTFASGNTGITISSITVTTGGNVYQGGEYAIAAFAREQATAATAAWTPGTNWTNFTNTTTSTRDHDAVDTYSNPPSGATLPDAGTMTSAATSFAAAVIAVFSPATSGPPASWTGPAGVRGVLWRTGLAMASLIPGATPPPPAPTSGPPFYPAVEPARARQLPLRGGYHKKHKGAPVQNPSQGPPFYPVVQAVRARLPRQPLLRGRCYSSPPQPVRNPSPGPVFRQKPVPVRYVLPPWQPRAGRIGSSFGGPVINPHRGPPVYAPLGPVAARRPFPPRGRTYATPPHAPAPATPAPFRQATTPVRARQPLPRRGRVISGPGGPVQNPNVVAVSGAIPGPVRASLPANPRGRVRATLLTAAAGTPPVHAGPPFFPAVQALRARLPQQPLLRGRAASNPGGTARNPAPGPVFFAAVRPARAVVPQVFSRGRVSGNPGAPARNPSRGPVFRQAVTPSRARQPLPPRGRTASNPGGPVQNPPPVVTGPPFYPVTRVRPQPGPRPGLVYSSTLIGPSPASQGVIAYNTGAAASAITATSVNLTIPSGVLVNDLMVLAVTLFTEDATPPSVSITGGPWTLVSVTAGANPEVAAGSGVFSYDYAYTRVATGIDPGATITLSETGSDAGSTWWGAAVASYTGAATIDVAGGANAQGGAGTTVTCPGETTTIAGDWAVYLGGGAPGGGASFTTPAGSTTRQAVVSAAGIGAVITDSGGSLNAGTPIGGGTFGSSSPATVWLTAFTTGIAPAVTPGTPPAGASQFFTGRIGFSYGAPAANPQPGTPAPALQQPVRARQPLPPRGRVASSPGAPVQNPSPVTTGPVFFPARTPARARITPPPRGRISFNAGTPARNPRTGPVFRQAVRPARAVIPQTAARGVYAAFGVTPPPSPAGTITYNTGAANSADTATSVTLTIPSGVLPGDAMLLAVTCFTQDSSAPAVTITGGPWNLLGVTTGANPEAAIGSGIWSYGFAYYRIATGGDPGATLTISETGSPAPSTWLAAAVASYTGPASGGTIDVAGGANAQGAAFTTVTCPAETTGGNGDWAVYLGGGSPGAGSSFTTPAGSTSRQAIVSGAGIGAVITDSGGSAGPAGTVIGGGTFGSSSPATVWLTAFTVGLAAPTLPAAAQSYAPFYSTGRVSFSYGAQVRNPPVPGPVFYPLNHPVQAKALPRRRGLCRAIRFIPQTGNPSQGPPFYPAVQPVQAQIPVPFLKGRVASNPGGPVRTVSHGPVFRQATSPAVARRPLPPRGRTAGNRGAPVQNPRTGPVFRQATAPARIRPSLPPRGRTGSNPGGPVHNPPPPVNGPVFYPAVSPARIRPTLPPRGRITSSPGAPARNPVQGAAFPAQHRPARARLPLPAQGRTSGNRGVLAVPVPVTGPPVYPPRGPVAARRPLPPRGRVTSGNPGAPVRNPHAGQPFRSLPWPARTRIPQNAPRGRTSGNPGGPVENIPFATLLFRLGTPYFQWDTETPGLTSDWATGTPVFGWDTGVPETSA